jgi:hypothetical protein
VHSQEGLKHKGIISGKWRSGNREPKGHDIGILKTPKPDCDFCGERRRDHTKGCKVPKKTCGSNLNNDSRGNRRSHSSSRVNFERSLKTERSAQRPFVEARGEASSPIIIFSKVLIIIICVTFTPKDFEVFD